MKKKFAILLISYSEAFMAVIPFVTIMAIAVLLSSFFHLKELKDVSQVLNSFFPFILLISISTQLAKRYKLTQLIPISLSLGIFVCVEDFLYSRSNFEMSLFSEASLFVLIIPILTIKLLLLLTPKNQRYIEISGELNNSIKYIYSAIFVFCLISTLLVVTTNLIIKGSLFFLMML